MPVLKWIAGIFIDKIVKAIVKAVADYLARRQKKKQRKEELEEIKKIEDPKERANRMRDFLKS